MRNNNRITEAHILSGTGFMNWIHLTCAGVVADVLKNFDVAATTEIV